ncbi:MAG: LysE family translocator [Bacteroidota bacterium]
MFGIINFGAFIMAGILLNLTPGADTMYILGRSISQGKRSGVFSALGIASGALLHCLFAALGLSVLLAQSALAFAVVKYAGAAYLIYLGIKLTRSASNGVMDLLTIEESSVSLRKIYFSGMLTNVLNPKVALFFLAFLPQFIDPAYADSVWPFLLLGLSFVATGTIWCLALALFAARMSAHIRQNMKIKTWLDRITGGVFLLLGLKLALRRP